MSNSANTGTYRPPHHNRTVYIPATAFGPTGVGQPIRNTAWGAVPLPTGARPTYNQRPGQTFHGAPVPPSAGHNVNHTQSLHQTYVQMNTGRVASSSRFGGASRLPMPNDFRHNARYFHPVRQATDYQPRTGGHQLLSPPHISTATQQRGVSYDVPAHLYTAPSQPGVPYAHSHSATLLAGTYHRQSNWPGAAPPQAPTHVVQDNSNISSPTALSPSSPASLGSADTSLTAASPPSNATWSKEDLSATEFCPFPGCMRRCARRQETERHVRQHLSRWIYCSRPGCAWTGNRRYAQRQHFKKAHRDVPFPELEEYAIYDANGLVKQLLNKEISVEKAVSDASLSFQRKAAELGKLGIWRE